MQTQALYHEDAWVRSLSQASGPDTAAVSRLRDLVRRGLGRALGSRGVSDADLDDFAQDAVVRIIARISGFQGQSRFTSWAMAVALRVAYTELRRRSRTHVSLEDLGSPADDHQGHVHMHMAALASSDASIGERDLLTALRQAIDSQLTERQRTVVLAELAGVPQVVLAEQLQTNANAIYKMHHDARKKLRKALEDMGFTADDLRHAHNEA